MWRRRGDVRVVAERVTRSVGRVLADPCAGPCQAAASEQAAAAAAKPTGSLAGLQAIVAHDSDASVATGDGLNLGAGLIVEQALASVVGDTGAVDGALGTSFKAAFARFQESLGYSGAGADADGMPGKASLQSLADRTGAFIVAD